MAHDTFDTIVLDVRDGVAHLTLNRPESGNALNQQMALDLMHAAIRCGEDRDVRCVVITGAGPMFSVGGDLKSFHSSGAGLPAMVKETTTYLHAAMSRLARMNPPVVAAVNGTAAGAGMSIACAADLVIAARSARFKMAYTAVGLTPDGSSTWYLPRLIGMRRAQELMITNRTLSAAEALDYGLITQVVDDDALTAEVEALAQRLVRGPTSAFGSVKRLLFSSFSTGLETQMEHETEHIARAATREAPIGIRAFLAKRAPDFRGDG